MNPEDLENINEIDMECDFVDDDDFGELKIKPKTTNIINKKLEVSDSELEKSDYNPHTGVIISLSDSDDDVEVKTLKPLIVQDAQDIMNAANGVLGQHALENSIDNGFEDINAIDMECSVCDEDDYVVDTKSKKLFDFGDDKDFSEHHINGNNLKSDKRTNLLDFDENPEYFKNELISEEMIQEKKRISQGEVEKDYWDKIQKKHAASNKKGAYNTSFHLCGNPKAEMDMFNHDMKTGKIPTIGQSESDAGTVTGKIVASNASVTGAEASMANAGAASGSGESCCEDLETNELTNIKDILSIIGFDVIKNSDNSYLAIDLFDDDHSYECKNKEELFNQLKPYIDDCFLYPLEIKTGEKFNNYQDWITWYDEEKQTQYPKCAEDINYLKCIVLNLK